MIIVVLNSLGLSGILPKAIISAYLSFFPVVVGMVVVGFFALFHGHAHGGELGEATSQSFMIGFALATALLHAVGLGIGFAGNALPQRRRVVARIAGALTALGGFWLVAGA